MKKYFSVLFLSVVALMSVVAFNSCKKDDEPIDSSSIVGVWQASYAEWWDMIDGKIVDKGAEPVVDDIVYEFRASGKVDIYDDLNDYNKGIKDQTADWKISGNKLIISGLDDEDEIYLIENIGKNTLVLSVTEKDEEGGITWESYYKTTYKRMK